MEPVYLGLAIEMGDALRAIGVLGFLLYMAAFAGQQWGWLDGRSPTYSLLNVAAAACVLLSLLSEFNLASLLIQVSWICIGLVGLFLRLRPRAAA